ncbi:hypothetical protein [Flexibacterium corallicola]|uniref:hypothetical protein n=1 Tax=Flexibacterium corallicola TaxID=3037259 RepID=UPI00286FA70E|nr:hypothetical protein [Pseudovibrio sp. M1P-2-3]
MIKNLSALVNRKRILAGILLIASIVATWLLVLVILDTLYLHDPRHKDMALKPWMTPRYIVLTYNLPRPLVIQILSLDPKKDKGIRLGRIADEQGISMEELTARVRAAATQYREEQHDG